MKKFKELNTEGAVITAIGGMIFVTSLLSFMAIVAGWIPPVAGIIMELSVIMFVLVVSALFATLLTAAAMFAVSFLVNLWRKITVEFKGTSKTKETEN